MLLLVDRRDPAITTKIRQQLLADLSLPELERLNRFGLAADADRFLLGRGLLRLLLAQWLGCRPSELSFSQLANGKPVLAGAPQFNLSHSGDLILLGLHSDRAVGVDVEQERPLLHLAAIARRYLGEALWLQLQHLDEPAQRQAFLQEWCALEARLKAAGCGLSGLKQQSHWTGSCWSLQLPAGYQGAAALLASAGDSPNCVATGRADVSSASGAIHMASP